MQFSTHHLRVLYSYFLWNIKVFSFAIVFIIGIYTCGVPRPSLLEKIQVSLNWIILV